jgi:tripartite-type tricarboxylate transporter receptor subunit TctC
MKIAGRQLLVLAFVATFSGCAGFGVVATSDPAAKLRDAGDLFDRQDRPLIAERLIREAIDIYQSNNDQLGLAEAYRTYGFFFRSPSIEGKWNKFYRENGFLDKSAAFQTRYEKSIEYFEKARTIFAASNRFDALTNVDLNMGFTYVAMGNRPAACQAFDRSVESNRENLRQNPTARPALPKGFSSYDDYVTNRKKQYGCMGAQSYPDRSVHFVIQGSAAGTTYDVAAAMAKKLSIVWGQPVTVEAKGGGGKMALDTIGGVAKSPPDGHRLLLLSGTYAAIPSLYANLPYDPVKDFIPVASIVAQPNILVVGRTSEINSVSELVALAKAKPGQLRSGSTGVGSANHLIGETFKRETHIEVAHVPLGVKQVIQAVASGQVTFWFAPFSAAQQPITDGTLVPLGVSTARRFALLPAVPTVAEMGVRGFDYKTWYGVWAPAGTPQPIVDKLSADISLALAGSDLRDEFAKKGYEPLIMTPGEFARFVQSEIDIAARIIKAAGPKP